MTEAVRYSWTQPICTDCWGELNPDRPAHGLVDDACETERCVVCDRWTRSGIYIRIDPAIARYPSLRK